MAVVLIVESQPDTATALARIVERAGLTAVVVRNGPSSICYLAEHAVDLVILGNPMPGMTRLDVLRTLQIDGHAGATPVLMFPATKACRDSAKFNALAFCSTARVCDLRDSVTNAARDDRLGTRSAAAVFRRSTIPSRRGTDDFN